MTFTMPNYVTCTTISRNKCETWKFHLHNFTHLDATKAANPTDSQPKSPRISQTVSQNSNRHSLKRHASGSPRCWAANNQPVTEAPSYTAKLYPRRNPHYAPRWSMANCNEETESARPITSVFLSVWFRLGIPRQENRKLAYLRGLSSRNYAGW